MVFFHKHNVHASNIYFRVRSRNSWNHILNKNLLIEGITRYIHEKKQKQSFREVFSWESHENLMRLSWFRRSWEKNEILTSDKAHEKFSWECHFLMKISWESHEILMSFQFSWEIWDSHEQKSSWEILTRIGNSHENVIFSWESREILMRIQKLLRIFERVDPFWLIFFEKDLCGQISADGILYNSNFSATYLESVSSSGLVCRKWVERSQRQRPSQITSWRMSAWVDLAAVTAIICSEKRRCDGSCLFWNQQT